MIGYALFKKKAKLVKDLVTEKLQDEYNPHAAGVLRTQLWSRTDIGRIGKEGNHNNETIFVSKEFESQSESVALGDAGFYPPLRVGIAVDPRARGAGLADPGRADAVFRVFDRP